MVCEWVVGKVDEKYLKGPGGMDGSAGLGRGGKDCGFIFLVLSPPPPSRTLGVYAKPLVMWA